MGEVKSSSNGDLHARVTDLERENASIKSINNDLITRLERLEDIASSARTEKDLASR